MGLHVHVNTKDTVHCETVDSVKRSVYMSFAKRLQSPDQKGLDACLVKHVYVVFLLRTVAILAQVSLLTVSCMVLILCAKSLVPMCQHDV